MMPWTPMLKLFGGLAAIGSLMQSCTNGVQNRADDVHNFVNPPVCEETVNGMTGTTIIDGSTFGVHTLPDGRTVVDITMACNR